MRRIVALFVAAIMLSSCGALHIENRGLPKCSGLDRRPLNGDLWDWESKKNQQTGIVRSSFIREQKPRWNIAASEQSCGADHG